MNSNNSVAASAAPDPFDPAALRLSQNFAADCGVKKLLLTVPVKKPPKEWFVRVHPDEAYRLNVALLELKEERETYLIHPGILPDLAGETMIRPRVLFTAINRQGVLFLWPVNLPGTDGKLDDWSRSALDAANLAQRAWVRVVADMSLGAYQLFEAGGDLPDPTWPETPSANCCGSGSATGWSIRSTTPFSASCAGSVTAPNEASGAALTDRPALESSSPQS